MPRRRAAPATGVESVLTRDTDGTDVVGVGFPDRASAKGVTVSVRSRDNGHWGTWTDVGLSDSAPDPGTAEAAQAKVATEPVGVAGSEQVQIRVSVEQGHGPARPARGDLRRRWHQCRRRIAGEHPRRDGERLRCEAGPDHPRPVGRRREPAQLRADYVDKVKGAIVHHTVNTNTYSADQAAGLVRGIYAYHVNGNGWCDIGYQFLVDRFGRLYEGRFGGDYKNVVGAQAQGFNMQSFGISSIANHDPGTSGAAAPSSAVLSAIGKLIGWKAWLNGWDPSTSVSYTSAGSSRWTEGTVITKPRVSGHRDFNLTTCPGDLMFSKLSSIRSTATASYKAGVASTASEVAAASVVETYTRPSGSSFSLSGRGYGHGRGMSQYGAYGAALSGLTRDEILDFYYPGTTRSTAIGNPTVRVQAHGARVVRDPGRRHAQPRRHRRHPDGVALRQELRRHATHPVAGRGRRDGLTLQWLEKGIWRSTTSWKAAPCHCRSATPSWARCGSCCPTAPSATTAARCAACAPAAV